MPKYLLKTRAVANLRKPLQVTENYSLSVSAPVSEWLHKEPLEVSLKKCIKEASTQSTFSLKNMIRT